MSDPCRACGACCASVRVLFPDGDGRRVPRAMTEPAGIPGHRRMRRSDAGCCAFTGVVGEATACTIYEDRPWPCRAFERSTAAAPNPHCDAARARFGMPPCR